MIAKDYLTEEEIEETRIDLYSEEKLTELTEDDSISGFEEAFMQGYLTAF